jgi:hypothetical protein
MTFTYLATFTMQRGAPGCACGHEDMGTKYLEVEVLDVSCAKMEVCTFNGY